MAGFIVISMPYAAYTGSVTNADAIEFRDYPIYEPETEDNKGRQVRHLEPIAGMLYNIYEALSALMTHSSNARLHEPRKRYMQAPRRHARRSWLNYRT
jgi:hypothetical protein